MADFIRESVEWKKRKDAHEEREARLTQAERIVAIKERLAASSAGPWRACGAERGGCECCLIFGENAIVAQATYNEGDEEHRPGRKEDAAFIAHAKQDIPWLLQLVESDLARSESEESSHWLAKEIERLRAENACLRDVYAAAKKLLADNKTLLNRNGSVTDTSAWKLHQALLASDLASWEARRPSDLKQMPAWLLTRPYDEDNLMRTWTEDGQACVSDGRVLLCVDGVTVEDHERPNSGGGAPGKQALELVTDWTRGRGTTAGALADALRWAFDEDGKPVFVAIGPGKFDPKLLEAFLPTLDPATPLVVYVGENERAALGIRPREEVPAWTLVIMPRGDNPACVTLELQSPS